MRRFLQYPIHSIHKMRMKIGNPCVRFALGLCKKQHEGQKRFPQAFYRLGFQKSATVISILVFVNVCSYDYGANFMS